MAMKLLHAVVAVLTVLLYLMRQKYVYAGVCPAKRRIMDSVPPCCGDAFLNPKSHSSLDRVICPCMCNDTAVNTYTQPKYKRDPEISIDNEDIGRHPHD